MTMTMSLSPLFSLAVVLVLATLNIGCNDVVVVVSAVEFDGGNFGGGDFGMGKACPKYRCAKEHTAVPKPRSTTKFESTGCASVGAGGMMMMGGSAGSNVKPYEQCCHYFHACYQICGMSKKTCDTNFEDCANQQCELVNPQDDVATKDCKKDVSMSKMMIDMGGCRKYDQAQQQACDCVANTGTKVTDQRERGIRKFYEKFAPDSVSKIPGLMAKADTVTKLAGLLNKLVAKYFDADDASKSTIAIKEYDDPMQAYYDQMRKDEDKPPPSTRTTTEHEGNNGDDENDDDERIEL